MQPLGQHFLKNKETLEKIAGEVLAAAGEARTIIEIGAGHGELTKELANRISYIADRKNIPHIIAAEKDPELAALLRKKFADEISVEIVEGDVRKILPPLAVQLALGDQRFAIAGNIPYYLTGYLFRLIGELEKKPVACVFMVQKEVARRIVAKPPAMNRLAAIVQHWANPKILFYVGREDFAPSPKVDSAVIRLDLKPTNGEKAVGVVSPPRRRGSKTRIMDSRFHGNDINAQNPDHYFSLVHILFAQPRKTILNNLAAGLQIGKAEAEEKLRRGTVNPADRPQNLSVEDIEKLAGDFQ